MTYEMPELRLVGAARAVVLGPIGKLEGGQRRQEEEVGYDFELEKEW